MAKRTVAEFLDTSGPDDGHACAKAPASKPRRVSESVDEMGDFEDAWEDELESDEDVVNTADDVEDGVSALHPCSAPS
jgi:ribosome assembly protein RRB1